MPRGIMGVKSFEPFGIKEGIEANPSFFWKLLLIIGVVSLIGFITWAVRKPKER